MATFTLAKMAAGGMHDHVGGGFHRYSVDELWHVPHFEKVRGTWRTLALQGPAFAQIAHAHCDAYITAATGASGQSFASCSPRRLVPYLQVGG